MVCDGGYTGKPFAEGVAAILPGVEVEVVKRNELKTFVVLHQRWPDQLFSSPSLVS